MSEQVAVITGAGRGIGEAIANELAGRGMCVVLAARTEETLRRVAREIEASGGTALVAVTDVTDPVAVERLAESTLERFGRADVLVNNAGASIGGTVAESDPVGWMRTIRTNLDGTYLCSRAFLPTMLERGEGQIVNILSIAAKTAFAGASAYCAAKAGALMFTRTLATEVRDQGVRVTGILPGATDTPFWDGQPFAPDRSEMLSPERVAETVAFVVTQSRTAAVDEVLLLPPRGIL